MDIWILIVAAGSAYLAQFWQSSKGAYGHIIDEDDDHPDSLSLSTPKRKCHYVSTQKRKAVDGLRFFQKRHAPELSQSGATSIPAGCSTNLLLPLLDDSESWKAEALCNDVRGDACSCLSTPKQSKRRHNVALSYSTSGSNTSFSCLAGSSFNTISRRKCCDFVLVGSKASSSLTGTFPDDCGCCTNNLYPEDHLESCRIIKIQDRCAIGCVKAKYGNSKGNEVQAFLLNRAWKTGYYEQREDVCALGSSDAHVMHGCEGESGNQEYERGSDNNLLKRLLFDFGVGVGMMFAIMSNKHGTQQRIGQLEEAMSALKGLEGEIQGSKKLRLGFSNTRDIRESILSSCSVLDLVQKVFELVEQVRTSLVKNSASVSATDSDGPQERARLEAELEAELERMEMGFNPGNATNFCDRYPCTKEDGLAMGNIVQDKLSTRHIPCDVDTHLSSLDGNNSVSPEYIPFENFAVSPVELAKRLYEVSEARQEERIMELEAEIKRLDNGLHAKERQFQAWKQRVRHLLEETACMSLSSLQEDLYVDAEITSVEALFSSTNKEDFSVVGLECSVSSVRNNEKFSTNALDNAHSMNSHISQSKSCFVRQKAYGKACEGWLHSLDGSISHLHDGLLKDVNKRDLWSNGTMKIHPEVVNVSYGSVASGGSNNTTFDILGSSTCSVISMGREMAAQEHPIDQLKIDLEVDTNNLQERLIVELNGERMPCSEFACHSQDICAQDVIDICESHVQCGRTSDLSTSEDDSTSSDLDEQLGQLLNELHCP